MNESNAEVELTFEVSSQAPGDDKECDRVEEHLYEPEAKPSASHIVTASHISDNLKQILLIK